MGFECERAVVCCSSSTAGLPTPLIPAARSRSRRSAHRERDLKEAVLHVPNMLVNSGGEARYMSLCIMVSLGVCASLAINLADELERVERAGVVQMHHDGVVHDGQAPPPASSSPDTCARPASVPPNVWNTQEVSSKLATSSSSSEAAGETAACHAIEQRSPHGRHGEREQRGQPLSPAASRRVGKFFPATITTTWPETCGRGSAARSCQLSQWPRPKHYSKGAPAACLGARAQRLHPGG